MVNTINTGDLATLKQGQTLLVNARKVAGDKIQLEFAEVIQDVEVNLLQMFNASDDRFKRGARRAWLTAEPSDSSTLLGIDLTDDSKYYTNEYDRVVMDLNILNPVINGMRMRVQITEQTTPTSTWDVENVETAAKRKGKGGDFILHNGKHIFTKSEVVLTEPKHTFLTPDSVTSPTPAHNVFEQVDTETGEIFS
jgi:hypothetical protein